MNLFSYIKSRVSILDTINEYVTLKKAGGYYKGTCPFHHEKTASFTVSPDKEIFYCFGCHITGDVISFIAKIENCSPKDAAQLLSERYSIDLPEAISFELSETKQKEKNHYFGICKAVALWCHAQLVKNSTALGYFHERGFDMTITNYFMLGYFPSGNAAISDLIHCMKKESILIHDLIDAHILAQGRTTLYSPFEERLIFPIKDSLGRYCGFGGRIFKAHDTRPKYYNSRENDYFIKGSLLFNLDNAKKNIQETGTIFLVEGYTDCMAMVKYGLINTVATLGTACTIEHLKQLARYAEQLFIVYDNDTAGQQALLRVTEMCWHVNLELKVIVLPPGEDPASFLSHNSNMQELIHKAQDIFIFFINTLGKGFLSKPLNQKMNIARALLTTIGSIQDLLKRDMLLQKAAHIFDIPFTSLKDELNRLQAQQPAMLPADSKNVAPTQLPQEEVTILEKRIFCAIVNNNELLQRKNNKQHIIYYLPTSLKNIILQLEKAQKEDNLTTFTHFFDTLNEHEKQYVGGLLLEKYEPLATHEFDKLLVQLQKKHWKVIVHDIKAQLAHAKQEGNMEKVSLILHNFIEMQNTLLQSND